MDRITLSEWAKQENISYKTAHARYKQNKIPFDTEKTNGRIFVNINSNEENTILASLAGDISPHDEDNELSLYSSTRKTSLKANDGTTSYRRNRSSTIVNRLDKYKHIEDGATPFIKDGLTGYIDIAEIVELCQKAYYNFSIFRNTIDLMTEFSANKIFFKGKSQRANKFFKYWAEYINIQSFQNRFFREYFRSGNVFIYKIETKLDEESIRDINTTFNTLLQKKSTIPVKYIILNPISIKTKNTLNFENNIFYKRLTPYEVERLRNPITDQDKETRDALFKKLSDSEKQAITNRYHSTTVDIKLDSEDVYAVFYKKQDYEPFAMPMGFPILDDLNAKAELKKIDMSVARTMQQVILLVTTGDTINNKPWINPDSIKAIQAVFQNESVGRVLVSDYTTNAKFVIPDIADILTKAKYEIINEDIKEGLNNILVGGDDKFSNQSIKVDVFLERLNEAREIFLNDFLKPEIKRISKIMGFKNVPEPEFEEFRFKNNVDYARLYSRLGEMGVLTPDEVIQAIETDRLPTPEESRDSQTTFRDLRNNEDLYNPIVGGNKGDNKQSEGRPAGSGSPIGDRKPAEQKMAKFGINAIAKTIEQYTDLSAEVYNMFKDKIDRQMREELMADIMIKYPQNQWSKKLYEYAKNKMANLFDATINEQKREVLDIASQHGVDDFQAAILYHSKVDCEQDNA